MDFWIHVSIYLFTYCGLSPVVTSDIEKNVCKDIAHTLSYSTDFATVNQQLETPTMTTSGETRETESPCVP
jgi:hypothetical protein